MVLRATISAQGSAEEQSGLEDVIGEFTVSSE